MYLVFTCSVDGGGGVCVQKKIKSIILTKMKQLLTATIWFWKTGKLNTDGYTWTETNSPSNPPHPKTQN